MKSTLARILCLIVPLAGPCACTSSRPSLPLLTHGLHGQIFAAGGPDSERHPAVVIIYGRGGFHSSYLDDGRFFAAHGIDALVLDYYAELGWGGATEEERGRRWAEWQQRIVASVRLLQSRSDVDPDRIALVGMSQGAALALTTAPKLTGIRAVVDYFGPHPTGWYVGGVMGQRASTPDAILDHLPPVLIMHGTWDFVVPIGDSRLLFEQLHNRGHDVEFVEFPHAFHAFNEARRWPWQRTSHADRARSRLLQFLDARLGRTQPTRS